MLDVAFGLLGFVEPRGRRELIDLRRVCASAMLRTSSSWNSALPAKLLRLRVEHATQALAPCVAGVFGSRLEQVLERAAHPLLSYGALESGVELSSLPEGFASEAAGLNADEQVLDTNTALVEDAYDEARAELVKAELDRLVESVAGTKFEPSLGHAATALALGVGDHDPAARVDRYRHDALRVAHEFDFARRARLSRAATLGTARAAKENDTPSTPTLGPRACADLDAWQRFARGVDGAYELMSVLDSALGLAARAAFRVRFCCFDRLDILGRDEVAVSGLRSRSSEPSLARRTPNSR